MNPPLRLSSLRHDPWECDWAVDLIALVSTVCVTGDQGYGEWQRGAKESLQIARIFQIHAEDNAGHLFTCDAVN